MASPELVALIELLRADPILQGDTVDSMRKSMNRLADSMPVPDDVRIRALDAGGVPAEWTYVDDADETRTLLYFHGGGYCVGSPATHRLLVATLARESKARVLSVDYRLAPEHPYPACLEDACAAYGYLLDGGFSPDRIAVAGDSAGGGLTAAMQLRSRRLGIPLPAASVLLSPWLDLTHSGETLLSRAAVDVFLDAGRLRTLAAAYLADANAESPEASPIFADLSGMPPALIHVGDAEVLLDDSRRYARRAQAAGVDVTLEIWPELMHVFPAFHAVLPEARESIEKIAAFLRKHIP